MPPTQRRIETEEIGDVTVVRFVDRRILDEQNIQLIGDQLFALVDEDHRTKILLDFGSVEYLSSAALGKLLNLNKKVDKMQGQLRLCRIKPEILEVFQITRLDKVFSIYEDQGIALESFR
ncbi:STAS domain-containing protein [bacterium]|nr:STAS domain-containing protein [bacterium]